MLTPAEWYIVEAYENGAVVTRRAMRDGEGRWVRGDHAGTFASIQEACDALGGMGPADRSAIRRCGCCDGTGAISADMEPCGHCDGNGVVAAPTKEHTLRLRVRQEGRGEPLPPSKEDAAEAHAEALRDAVVQAACDLHAAVSAGRIDGAWMREKMSALLLAVDALREGEPS